MANIRQIKNYGVGEKDPYFSEVIFLMGGSLADQSSYNDNIVQNSPAIDLSAAQTKFNPYSLRVVGTDAGLVASHANFNGLHNLAWTIEGWVFLTSTANGSYEWVGILHSSDLAYVSFGYTSAGGANPKYLWGNTEAFGDQYSGFPTNSWTPSVWTHFALVRAAGGPATPIRIYKAGTYVGVFTDGTDLQTSGQSFSVGAGRNVAGGSQTIYLDEIRFTRNVERYTGTGSYIVPTKAFPRL